MKSLNEDLKTGQLKNVYLLYGEESYLKRQYRQRLCDALVDVDDKMNFARYEGKNVPVGEIIDLAETLPFFSERRLIVMEDTGLFKSASPEFSDYLKEMPETTFFIFVETEVDKRGKLYKAVQNVGRAVELTKQDESMLVRWIAGSAKKEGKQIAESTIRYFLGKVGMDMENIQKELEKLFCYTLEQEAIRVADVEKICTTQITNQIFDMVNAVAERKYRKALDYYYDLLALKEPPMRILFLLTRQFKQLLEVKSMVEKRYDRKEIAAKTGLPPFVVGKYIEQAKVFSSETLQKILEESAEIEAAVKTGNLTDVLGVELFILMKTEERKWQE